MKVMKFANVGTYDLAVEVLQAICPQMAAMSLIDLCSYEGTITKRLNFADKTFVDVMDVADKFVNGEKFVQADAIHGEHPVFDHKYDVSICLDGIEHVRKAYGYKLLDRMKALSDIQIFFTPDAAIGWMMDKEDSEDPTTHKCVWAPEDLDGEWAHVSFPEWHRVGCDCGAFFSWRAPNIEAEFERVKQVLLVNHRAMLL